MLTYIYIYRCMFTQTCVYVCVCTHMHAHAHAHAHTHAHTADRWYKGPTTTKTHKEQDTCNENASTSNKGQKHSTKFNISEEKRRCTRDKKAHD